MSNVDQFESVFRSAVKDVFVYSEVVFHSILVVTDLLGEDADAFVDKIKHFVQQANGQVAQWTVVNGDQYQSTEDLLKIADAQAFDLICTYRNLHSNAWQYMHSLGAQLDVLLQKTEIPVLVLPHPQAGYAYDHALQQTKNVMAVTDHLTNDHSLVNYSVRFTETNGQLFLAHIEDQSVFDRYCDAISKIPTVDTDDARRRLHRQLLKMPKDYVASCRLLLTQHRNDLQVHAIVQFGHFLDEYKKYIEQEHIDLLVMHAKDDDQLAMHGLAYPLAVELRQIPLLML